MLEKLRAKPDYIKQSISLVITIVIFIAIVFVWVSSKDTLSHEEGIQKNVMSPLSGVTSFYSDFASSVKDKFSRDFIGAEEKATTTKIDTFDFSGVVILDSSTTSVDISESI